MHICAEGRGLHFKGCCAPEADRNAPLVLRDLAPIGRDHCVGCQLAPVLLQERGHVGAADLLLPLQHDLHGPGQSVWERYQGQHKPRLMRGAPGSPLWLHAECSCTRQRSSDNSISISRGQAYIEPIIQM